MVPACQLIFDIYSMFATWDEKVILKKMKSTITSAKLFRMEQMSEITQQSCKIGNLEDFEKRHFFLRLGVRKPLLSGQKLFLRPIFPTNGDIFVYKGGLRFSFRVPEVPKPRVNWRYWWHLQWCKISVSSVIVSRNKCKETM